MSEERELSRRAMLRGTAGAAVAAGVVGTVLSAGGSAYGAEDDCPGGRRVPPERIAIQLYTLRSALQADLPGTLEALADIGYRNVELAGTYGRSAAEFRAMLDRYHLRAVSAHIGLEDIDQLVADARTLGYRWADCAWANLGSIEAWTDFARRLDKAGEAFRKAGISYGYHNHAHEFWPIDGVRPFDVIARNTSRRNIHFQYDLYWLVEAGVDPVEQFYAQFGRVRQFHVKDRAADGSFADLGTGTIDFARVFRMTRNTGVKHFIVEHDQPTDPLHTAKVGYEYLRDLRF